MDCLLFDFGGTLDADGLTWLDRFRLIYKEAGVDTQSERFERAFYDADDHLGQRNALAGLSLTETVQLQNADLCRNLGLEAAVGRHAAEAFLADARAHLKRNRAILERLAKHWKLGVVSNWYGNMDSVLRSEGLGGLFGTVADSEKVGAIKPDARIFQHALAALGAGAERSMMIGDSIKRDMRGAEALGMRHALLSPSGAACCGGVLKLKSLTELEDALAGAARP